MDQSEGGDPDLKSDWKEINETVREIFDSTVDGPMEEFKKALEFIKENELGLVWREEDELNDKVMRWAKTFIKAVITNISREHAEASQHIKGSTCDEFLRYVYEKLDNSLLGEDPFQESCNEIKHSIDIKIAGLKRRLEAKDDAQPRNISDVDVMISQTELFSPIHIHHALLCCQIAYDCKDPELSKHFLDEMGKEHLLGELSVSYENVDVPKYVMARCGDVLYVSFKGVQSHNFGSTEKSYRGEICEGIMKTAKKIPLAYFAREIIQNKRRILFSGHSSGGAIASIVLLFLMEKFKNLGKGFLKYHFKCITFGLMPLGDSMLKEYVEAIPGARECFCHIVQKDDIVPKLFGSFNMSMLQSKLWELVEKVLKWTGAISAIFVDPATAMLIENFQSAILPSCKPFSGLVTGFAHLNIFGTYYILDTSEQGQNFTVLTSEEAAKILRISDSDSLRRIPKQYLINHKLERYVHEVKVALIQELPDFKSFETTSSINSDVTTLKITEVLFENIGEEVVAKIYGSSMWFVYNVSINGVSCDGKDLKVDLTKSSENEVQTRMKERKIDYQGKVSIRVKTHFQNPKYHENIPYESITHEVTRRQQQLAKHSPRGIIELAFLSALMERRQEGYQSKRFKAIEKFFQSAVSVVPLESLFHAIATGKYHVVLECCKILSACRESLPKFSSSLHASMERALSRIKIFCDIGRKIEEDEEFAREMQHSLFVNDEHEYESLIYYLKQEPEKKRKEYRRLVDESYKLLSQLVDTCKKQARTEQQPPLYAIDLEVIYPSADVKDARKRKDKCFKAPITLLKDGRKELNRLSLELIQEHDIGANASPLSKTNIKMLSALHDLRKESETCNTLLGALMESQVKIPLERGADDKYVDKFAKHASSFGLSVWGLLILPFEYLNCANLSEDFRKFVVEFSRQIQGIRNYLFPSPEHQFGGYDERLEFLVGSMKQSWACNQNYVSYSLERQLEDQCKKRNIYHNTPVDEILKEWNDNFENETLTLVPKEYRILVARWIKWSLMINNLRESLASQTAVGVIGLVNSGKSTFVRSFFGKKTTTGTTDQKRTTVPLIYSLEENIKGLDVIDFPGVDEGDESIPGFAELLLSLTRIIIFVVDYRRAHTESTKQWLSILEREHVPVLVCLTFGDKLCAELMGKNLSFDTVEVKLGVEEQLSIIKDQIGQPASGPQRHFMLTVFSFDNDSNLNSDEGKEKLRQAGLKDELDVGRWIAGELQDYKLNEVSQSLMTFIEGKERSTLNAKHSEVPPEEIIGAPPKKKKKIKDTEDRPTSSKYKR